MVGHSPAAGKEADRQAAVVQIRDIGFGARLVVAMKLDPIERHIAAVEKIANHVRECGAWPTEDPDVGEIVFGFCGHTRGREDSSECAARDILRIIDFTIAKYRY